ncbi:MAG: HD domain-containing protein [Bacilli bacterium]|nr:HD domain-containing protein [Bacilli bacterium]
MKKKNRFTIRTKLLIMSMVTIAVAVATLGIFLSVSFADSAYQTAANTLESVSFNASQGLESSVNSSESLMILLANQIGYNKEFANYITADNPDVPSEHEAFKKHINNAFAGADGAGDGSTIIGAMEYMVLSNAAIESAVMYSPYVNEPLAYNHLFPTSNSIVECTKERYNALIEHSGRSYWFFRENDQEHFFVWKAIVNYGVDDNYAMGVVGYIEYVFNKAKFLVCISDTSYSDEGMILLDDTNHIVYSMSSGNEKIDEKVNSDLSSIDNGLFKEGTYTAYRQEVTSKGWSYITYIHHKSIDETIAKSIRLAVIIIVASVIVAALVSYLLAAREVKRIRNLSHAAGSISQGEYDVRLPELANDEITDVSVSFNVMAGKVQETLQELIDQQDSISENFATILSNKSGESGNHVKRVGEYSALLARELGFNENEVHDIRIASMLHDVGKIMIDESILHKPGKFTDEEYALMQKHVDFGGQLLKGVPGNIMQLGAIIAENHHERWDGNGYTHHKKGDEIPVEAQITSVADVFDALVSRRCYKGAWTIEDAYNEIVSQSGKQFSPRAVEAFQKCFEQFKHISEVYKDEE